MTKGPFRRLPTGRSPDAILLIQALHLEWTLDELELPFASLA